MRNKRSFLTYILLILLHSGCNSGTLNIFSTGQDVELGQRFVQGVYADQGQFPILDSTDYPYAYQRLALITNKILASGHIQHKDDFAWKIHIIHNDSVLNAFCTPGGYIFIYTGLIRFLQSEDQLAGVMGHEIAHADLRHSTEQLTKSLGLNLVTQLLVGDASVLTNMADHLLQLGFSRADESEADRKSVEYLYDTDYDPRGVAYFFQRMQQDQGLTFLSTHPAPDNRVKNIMAHWKQLGAQSGKKFSKEYSKLIDSLP
jgi:beta-barrel assembly-enhancing protease